MLFKGAILAQEKEALVFKKRAATKEKEKSVIEKFTIISGLGIRKRAIYGWKGMEVYCLKKLILH